MPNDQEKPEQVEEVQQVSRPRRLQELSLDELKALAYDHVLIYREAQQKLAAIEAEIRKRSNKNE